MIGPYSTEPAHIRIQPDGTVDVYLGSGSHGQGLETTTAQLVSEFLGVAFDDVTVHQGDTSETPYAFGTGGSRSGPILGAAIQGAAQELRHEGRRDRRPPAGSVARRHRHRRRRRQRARHARRDRGPSPRSPASRTSISARCRRAWSRASRSCSATSPTCRSSSRTRATSARSRSIRTPARSRSCATS